MEATSHTSVLLERLKADKPLVIAELRPPRADLSSGASMDAWLGMSATVGRLLRKEVPILLTDAAVGSNEEENLQHIINNLDVDAGRGLVCPFLTTKHTLEYCEWYAARALEAGCDTITVLGGDKHVGAPRCVPHGYLLREHLKARFPELVLGGWANPHADIARQTAYLTAEDFCADFHLTQLVSHHHLEVVDAFLEAKAKAGVEQPAIWGVFHYRSPNKKTLERLASFFPVPLEGLLRDFDQGMSATEITAKTIVALRERGIDKVYVSNLNPDRAHRQLKKIVAAVETMSI